MKLNLSFLLIFIFTIFSAQKKASDTAAISQSNKNQILSEKVMKTNETTEQKKISFEQQKDTATLVQNIDIVREINAVLNYKINRVWRRDLYCFACEVYDSGKIA